MGIFDRFKQPVQKPESEPVQNSDLLLELPDLCYQIAYLMLPPLVFSEPERTIGQFIDDPALAGPYFYFKAVVGLHVQAVREHALAFHTHWGELSADKNYYILEYPVPPPLPPAATGSLYWAIAPPVALSSWKVTVVPGPRSK